MDNYKSLENALNSMITDNFDYHSTLQAVCKIMLNIEIEGGLQSDDCECFELEESTEQQVNKLVDTVISEAQAISNTEF